MKNESSIEKLKRLIKESKEIRSGNLFGKKKHVASKMTHSQKSSMWKRDGVGGKRPTDSSRHPDQGSFDRREGGKKFKAEDNE